MPTLALERQLGYNNSDTAWAELLEQRRPRLLDSYLAFTCVSWSKDDDRDRKRKFLVDLVAYCNPVESTGQQPNVIVLQQTHGTSIDSEPARGARLAMRRAHACAVRQVLAMPGNAG